MGVKVLEQASVLSESANFPKFELFAEDDGKKLLEKMVLAKEFNDLIETARKKILDKD